MDSYRSFYMGKMKELLTMKDAFKKRYLLSSMKLIMNSSFIVDKIGSLGKMPPQVETLLNILKKEDGDVEKPVTELPSNISMAIKINAPLKKVFEYVAAPENWSMFVTSLIDIRNVSDNPIKRGMTYDWTYRMIGVNLDGEGKVVEYNKHNKFSLHMGGAFPLREVFRFNGDTNSTTLNLEIQYEVPGKVLGVIANKLVIEKLNKKEAAAVIKKVKDLCEANYT